jgi:hypothetical protein
MVKLSNSHWQSIPVESTDGIYRIRKWYIKPPYPDYAPSGMPDFDERQWGTYNWTDNTGAWSHCGPVAVANSLWWMDSKYESLNSSTPPVPPPIISDDFCLVTSYSPGVWDDHDPQNVQPLIEHLAYLMDCDGLRTNPGNWSGTFVFDMEAGIAQYLSWSGVNPLGDVNGDGVVNGTDQTIVNNAMGTSPGHAGWNVAADIWPETVTGPYTADNVIDANDMNLVLSNMGKTGFFYEHTVDAECKTEFFGYIEEEVEKSQDVVLLLGIYCDGHREYGHYITVAGVNSSTMELLISNPIRDEFEAGKTPGRSPVPHWPHPPPEPPYTTHNNASLVSHDAYTVVPSGHPVYHWALEGYEEGCVAVIEYAVITSPTPAKPDLEIIDGEEHEICDEFWVKINVTHVVDLTDFDFTILYNDTCLECLSYNFSGSVLDSLDKTCTITTPGIVTGHIGVSTPWSGESGLLMRLLFHVRFTTPIPWKTDRQNITVPIWFEYAKLSFLASPDLIYEKGVTEDQILVQDKIVVINLIQGDVTGDGVVDIFDLRTVAAFYDLEEGDPDWDPTWDLNGDGIIDIFDLVLIAVNFGYS